MGKILFKQNACPDVTRNTVLAIDPTNAIAAWGTRDPIVTSVSDTLAVNMARVGSRLNATATKDGAVCFAIKVKKTAYFSVIKE